jgi:hypothetical protein
MQKICIHSVPRSGSTWLGSIFDSHPNVIYKYQPLFSYAFKDYLNEASTKDQIDSFFKKIETSNDPFINQIEAIKKEITPLFIKSNNPTHICYKEVRYHHILENMIRKAKDVKVILLIRNPLAVLYSWKNAPKEFREEKGWIFEKEWQFAPLKNNDKKEEYNGYEKWKEATHLFLHLKKKYPENVKIVNYSDLLNNTIQVVEDVYNFTGLKVTEQTLNFLTSSKSKNHTDAYSVFKVKKTDNQWHKLPTNIIDFIKKDLEGTVLEKFINE